MKLTEFLLNELFIWRRIHFNLSFYFNLNLYLSLMLEIKSIFCLYKELVRRSASVKFPYFGEARSRGLCHDLVKGPPYGATRGSSRQFLWMDKENSCSLDSAKGERRNLAVEEESGERCPMRGIVVATSMEFWREPPIRRWLLLIPGGPGKREDERMAAAGETLTFQVSGPPYICVEG